MNDVFSWQYWGFFFIDCFGFVSYICLDIAYSSKMSFKYMIKSVIVIVKSVTMCYTLVLIYS